MLRDGDLLAIFPEGGIIKILENAKRDAVDAPVIPMALTNMWGSYFSRIEKGNAMTKSFRRGVFSRVGLHVDTALAPDQVQPSVLLSRVAILLAA